MVNAAEQMVKMRDWLEYVLAHYSRQRPLLVHDFSDGINTVGLIMRTAGSRRRAFSWLTLDAIAPVAGVVSTMFFAVSGGTLGIILAIFCGFFLYIGASDLIPESHHAHPKFMTTLMTILGVGVLYVAIHLIG